MVTRGFPTNCTFPQFSINSAFGLDGSDSETSWCKRKQTKQIQIQTQVEHKCLCRWWKRNLGRAGQLDFWLFLWPRREHFATEMLRTSTFCGGLINLVSFFLFLFLSLFDTKKYQIIISLLFQSLTWDNTWVFPWISFLRRWFMLSKGKHETAHNGPSFFVKKTRCFEWWILIDKYLSPLFIYFYFFISDFWFLISDFLFLLNSNNKLLSFFLVRIKRRRKKVNHRI